MSGYKDDFRDDEFRIIGTRYLEQIQSTTDKPDEPAGSAEPAVPPMSGEPRKPRKSLRLLLWLLATILLLVIANIALHLLRQAKEDPLDGVFETIENPSPPPIPTVKVEPKLLGHEPDSLQSFTEKVDTVINDIPLSIYIPHNAKPELTVGPPDFKDGSIIFSAQAADIRGDNYQILGAFVLKGKPLAWGLSKKGYCAIIDGEISVGVSENSPLFEKATETEGYFFRQFGLVDNGVLVENELKNKSERRALCSRYGQIFVAFTNTPESFHDFAQALVDLGVDNAIYLVGSRYAFGSYTDSDGTTTQFGDGPHKYKYENYLVWRR